MREERDNDDTVTEDSNRTALRAAVGLYGLRSYREVRTSGRASACRYEGINHSKDSY